jgi:hypothetical protein
MALAITLAYFDMATITERWGEKEGEKEREGEKTVCVCLCVCVCVSKRERKDHHFLATAGESNKLYSREPSLRPKHSYILLRSQCTTLILLKLHKL